ncbi:response regulator [Hymenobacter sp. BRD128]|uniref:PAS domain-containing hybrid sensor histidine kinase/response regulator n=1 Tax=Hymenobacter sp. BRD128 TaxID=2675878 RepID=UPI00156580CA|nr:ATP-binding protein [Hymenobacter sp. BRD128]QKG57570.1 response regulator [Hymenobacter sp. BRD128]
MSAPGSSSTASPVAAAPPKQTLAQARAEAARASQHLAALASGLREGILLLDADQRVLLANEQFCTLLGLPMQASQCLGLHTSQLTAMLQPYLADPAAYAAELAGRPNDHIPSTLLALRDGRTLERDARPVALGDTIGWLLSYRDVTQQHQADTQRDAQRKFYETILDEVPVEIAVLDEQRRYVYVNPQAVPDPEHRAWLPGRTLAEYCARYGFPLELADYRDRMFELAEASAEPVSWDDRTPVSGGEVHHQRQFKLLSGAGKGLPYMLGSGLDVTARVQAEERSQRSELERREQQEFMQQVLDTIPSPVYVRDVAGEVVFGNRALFKLDEQAALFAPTEQVLRAKEREAAEYAAIDAQVLATGREVVAEERSTSPTGEERWFYSIKRPLVRPDGAVQVLGVSTDITALKAAQLAAEDAAKARENFLANMSHEIRTPMNGVLGMAALLAKTRLSPQQQEFVRTIRSSGTHLLGVLNDVLDVSKIHSGKLEMEAVAFHLHDSMQQAVATLTLQAQEKGLVFGFKPFATDEAPWVRSDPFRLNQILLNLLSNAIKFTTNGSVWLRSFLVDETDEELLVRFTVQDTGIGIGDEALERIFESFTQAYADTTRRYGGTGLGLTISRALVTQLGGELSVASKLGQGSTFSFTIPLRKTEQPTPTVVDAFDTGQLRGIRVLLAEDNPINRTVARLHLLQWGVEVDEAEDGRVALQKLLDNVYDVVLMDIQMPHLSGIEVTQQLRQLPDAARAAVPVLALTANVFRSDNEKYLAAGMDDYLAKPFAEEHLYAKLLNLLRPPAGTTASLAPAPAYDLTRLHHEARGNPAFVAGMVNSFLTHMPPSLQKIRAAAEARDWLLVAELVHHIKPNLLTLSIEGAIAAMHILEPPPTLLPTPDEPARLLATSQLLAAVEAVLLELPGELT